MSDTEVKDAIGLWGERIVGALREIRDELVKIRELIHDVIVGELIEP